MYLVLRMANSMSRRNKNYLGASKRHVHAVDLLKQWVRPQRGRKFGPGRKERGRNHAPALNSGYTELDIFRMTSSPSLAPSPNALFALLRCALWRQPTGGAVRGFRISMTGVDVR